VPLPYVLVTSMGAGIPAALAAFAVRLRLGWARRPRPAAATLAAGWPDVLADAAYPFPGHGAPPDPLGPPARWPEASPDDPGPMLAWLQTLRADLDPESVAAPGPAPLPAPAPRLLPGADARPVPGSRPAQARPAGAAPGRQRERGTVSGPEPGPRTAVCSPRRTGWRTGGRRLVAATVLILVAAAGGAGAGLAAGGPAPRAARITGAGAPEQAHPLLVMLDQHGHGAARVRHRPAADEPQPPAGAARHRVAVGEYRPRAGAARYRPGPGGYRPGDGMHGPATMTIRLRPGDTLWALALRYGTTVAHLQALNGLGGSTVIYAGASLRIPPRPGPLYGRAAPAPAAGSWRHRGAPPGGSPVRRPPGPGAAGPPGDARLHPARTLEHLPFAAQPRD
jgi:LysM domain